MKYGFVNRHLIYNPKFSPQTPHNLFLPFTFATEINCPP